MPPNTLFTVPIRRPLLLNGSWGQEKAIISTVEEWGSCNLKLSLFRAHWEMRQNEPMMIATILLAAGESKRMCRPKLLMPLGRSTILEQTVDNFLNSQVNEVIVVVGYRHVPGGLRCAARGTISRSEYCERQSNETQC